MSYFFNILRTTKKHLIIPKIKKPPVIIIASRRGGSSLVSDMLSSQKGVWISNEPFAVLPAHPNYNLKQRLLPFKEHSQYFNLIGEELDKFKSYVSGLLSIEHRKLGTCINTKFPLITDRVCLKILNTPWMLEWYIENTNAQVIFFTRHPGSQAVSVLRQGWDFPVKAYFNKAHVLRDIFSEEQVEFGFEIIKNDNAWEVAILDWVVTTHVGRTSKKTKVIKTTYEHIVSHPDEFIADVMINTLGCDEVDKIRKTLSLPSGSSRLSTDKSISAIQSNNKSELLSLWRNHVDEKQLLAAQAILDKFDVKSYSMYENMPLVY